MVLVLSSELSQKIYEITYCNKHPLHDVLSSIEEEHMEKEMKILTKSKEFTGGIPYHELFQAEDYDTYQFVILFKNMKVDQMVETNIKPSELIQRLQEDIMGFVWDIGQAMHQKDNNQTISVNPFAAMFLFCYPSYEFHTRGYLEIRKFVGEILTRSMTPLVEGIDSVCSSGVEPCISDLFFYDCRTCQSYTKQMKAVIDTLYPLNGEFFHSKTREMFLYQKRYAIDLSQSENKKPIFIVEIISEYLTCIITAILNCEHSISRADYELLHLLEEVLTKLELMDDVQEYAHRIVNLLKLPRTVISYIRYLYLDNETEMKRMAATIEHFIDEVGCDSDTAKQYIQIIDFFHRKKYGTNEDARPSIHHSLHQKNIRLDEVS